MVTAETVDLIGTWRLVSVSDWADGELRNPHAMGPRPAGYITYTAAGRMMVLLDRRSLELGPGARYGIEPIFAYAGTFTRSGAAVVHHLEMCTALADIGTDYVRNIEVVGDNLFLCTEPMERKGKTRVSKLEWCRDIRV